MKISYQLSYPFLCRCKGCTGCSAGIPIVPLSFSSSSIKPKELFLEPPLRLGGNRGPSCSAGAWRTDDNVEALERPLARRGGGGNDGAFDEDVFGRMEGLLAVGLGLLLGFESIAGFLGTGGTGVREMLEEVDDAIEDVLGDGGLC